MPRAISLIVVLFFTRDKPRRVVVAKVLADTAQFADHRNADRLQQVPRPDTGDLQQPRRVGRAA
jgi:hypothetical protein